MSAPASPLPPSPEPDVLGARFLVLLPRIELHVRISFRHLKGPDRQEEAVAEAVALSWKWFLRLAECGKDAADFVTALATFAARAVRSGRRVCGQEKPKDVLAPRAQRRHGFTVSPLPGFSTLYGNVFDEALHDNAQTPVPEQVSFRLDFPAWRRTLSERDRRLTDDLMLGERTLDVSRKYGLSPARVSQKRRAFHADWLRFHGEAAPPARSSGAG